MSTPPLAQRLRYYAGAELAPEYRSWVQHDLVGPGAMERYILRFIVPVLPFFVAVLLFPGPIGLKLGVIAIMALPMVVFTAALSYVWRRFRLQQHGLDPHLVDRLKTTAHERMAYMRRYGHQ